MAEIHCRHFNGYKPCGLSLDCSHSCPHLSIPQFRICIVHLEALGAVLRATSILPAILRKYPRAHVTWVTKTPAERLLENNPLIDRVLTISHEDLLKLSNFEFDVVFSVDKGLVAAGVLKQVQYKQCFGFRVDSRSGAIVPSNREALELWQIGLSDSFKFFANNKTETQLLIESLALGAYEKDEYILELSKNEKLKSQERRKLWGQGKKTIVGINTGCANTIPYKKLPVNFHREVIHALNHLNENIQVVLLGGREDQERNQQIALDLDVIQSPTDYGLRDGVCSVDACDVVLSGDSLGMHMGIALKKWVVAWFGPTCPQEIELYDRGEKVVTETGCAPCWKRSCQKAEMCYDRVPLEKVIRAIMKGVQWHRKKSSSSKRPLSETPSLQSPSL